MKDLVITGLKKVVGETKAISLGEKGLITYDKKTGKVSFDGYWFKDISVKVTGLSDSEIAFLFFVPMTMRELKKKIAESVDYDTYLEMDLEDTGYAKINS